MNAAGIILVVAGLAAAPNHDIGFVVAQLGILLLTINVSRVPS